MEVLDRLVPELLQTVEREGLLAPGDRVLVAVSGGADSTALACLLHALGTRGLPLALTLAHLDHGWRGPAAAGRDEAQVQGLAASLRLPLLLAGRPMAPTRSEGAARQWRYRTLAVLAGQVGARTLVTGHHRRDQAETVCLRLERGSGPHGLAGMRAQRPLGFGGLRLVRPLLRIDPRRLRAWLRAAGQGWVEDETNRDVSRDRARVRVQLAQSPPGTEARLAAFADRVRDRLQARRTRALRDLGPSLLVPPHADAIRVDRAALLGLPPPLFEVALRDLGGRIGADREGPFLTRRHLDLLRTEIEQGGAVDLPRGTTCRAGPRHVWLLARGASRDVPLPLPQIDVVRRREFSLATFLRTRSPWEAVLDADVLGPTPKLRFARPTDTFLPYRSPASEGALFRWLARQGVPGWMHPRTVVLEGQHGIAWVPGHREHARAVVAADTGVVARVRFEPVAG